jgi:catechol 2,3-dioxygenase-like lactoylglutathione lyase family enzyme
MIVIDHLDHLVRTVRDLAVSIDFYTRVLAMQEITFNAGRKALGFGAQRINLHVAGAEFEPKAARPTPGSADICLIVTTPLEAVIAHLTAAGVTPETEIVARTGAAGALRSIYLRDPDGNLIELSNIVAT